jgi:glycosyltransferase involved in cell wall biosynthesis
MNNEKHLVSVVVICRNEEKFIARCLDSIIGNDYPKDRMEVLVVDGMSDDQTRAIVNKYQKRLPFVHLLDNPRKFTPFAMNIGARNAKGDYIIFVGSHCTYDKYYLSNSIRAADQSGADNVGGIWKIIPQGASFINQAIVAVSSSLLGAGNAYYRRGQAGGPREVDTVFGGCYRKEVFKKIGWFNERLARSQDMEFNMRLKKAGGKIMMFPDIICYYYPKSNFKDFLIHNFWDGVWAVYPLKFIKTPLKLRHYIPMFFVLSLILFLALGIYWYQWFIVFFGFLAVYVFSLLFFSAQIAIREKEWRYLFLMPVAFTIRHFGYGLGSFWGIIRLIMPQKNGGKS